MCVWVCACLLRGELPEVDAEVVHEAAVGSVGVPVRCADEVLGQLFFVKVLVGTPGEGAVEVDPPVGAGAEGHAHVHPLVGGGEGRGADGYIGKDHRAARVHSDD
jgi:hypothetical protein